jgi:PTH1 family peptidyl-tRNA hydrolase
VKIVVGLGNPGRDYERTRHNIGFAVAAEFVRGLEGVSQRSRFKSILQEGVRGTTKYVVAQPQMYMNLSGIPVREIVNWYKIDLDDLLVVYDDMDLPIGQLRLRADGSAGGHNGMKSIIQELGTNQFSRLRIGIGRGRSSSTAHVLSRFTGDEQAAAEEAITEAVEAILLWSERGTVDAMNIVNRPAAAAGPASGVTSA